MKEFYLTNLPEKFPKELLYNAIKETFETATINGRRFMDNDIKRRKIMSKEDELITRLIQETLDLSRKMLYNIFYLRDKYNEKYNGWDLKKEMDRDLENTNNDPLATLIQETLDLSRIMDIYLIRDKYDEKLYEEEKEIL